MRRFGLRIVFHRIAKYGALVTTLAATIAVFLDKLKLESIPNSLSFLQPGILRLQSAEWYVIPGITAIATGFVWWNKSITPPWIWEAVHVFMDSYRDPVFKSVVEDPIDHHRITLFQYFPWWKCIYCARWPWKTRLIPVERSGHISQRTSSTFCAPDDPEKAEGIAGRAWRTLRVITVSGLPDVRSHPTEANISDYARRTWVKPSWVRSRIARRKSLARSYVGIPIRANGKPWGVIVIDSMGEKTVESLETSVYDLMGKTLSPLLERV